MENTEQKKSASAEREEKVLSFWKENNVFEESLKKESPKGEFVFFEGPPTANGKPGIHHLEARAFKDAIPRYKTMQGFHVRRKGGWDTHGLPVELQVEKALGLNSKKAIEEYGIEKFNKQCKESVWQYLSVWEKFTDRIGYWVDQKNPYVTYHNDYIESVWNVLKKVNDQGLVYKDYRIVPWCPRCGTALSSHELAQGYQDDKDLSVTAKFKVVGQADTYILAWTTTPWTLPGNVALAVGNDIEYVLVQTDGGKLWLAKDLSEKVASGSQVVETKLGSELVGLEYEPLYPYLKDNIAESQKENLTKAFKVYAADFVTTTDGTGVVHTAVMYGADDFELGTKLGLPKQHMVNLDGTFVAYADFLAGRFVKDEDVAIDIIKDLAHRGLLFKKEKYEHSYPHCWRCKTPLIYYARDSWYIRMSDGKIKEQLIEENKKINWEPNYIRDGRFGEWLKDIKDWAISRERYWGTPLPIWTTESGNREVLGSLAEIRDKTKKSGNTYFVIRHGEATHNLQGLASADPKEPVHLTELGKQQVAEQIPRLKEAGVDLIIASPFVRTRETAEILRDGIDGGIELMFDERLREIDIGVYNHGTWEKFHEDFPKTVENFDKAPEGGESYQTVKSWMMDFMHDIEIKYQNKKILIVTHGGPAWLLMAGAQGYDAEQTLAMVRGKKDFHYFQNAEVQEVKYVPFPHNNRWELDVHRPYIDQIQLVSESGEPMTRVKEVMDVWFDSGAMPYAQDHYPFENKALVDGPGYPADFISEAIDQTRGWFYTLHAVGVLMGRGLAYKNVICLGHILDKEGKKMSKSLGNIVDPWEMIEKYGVDTLRLWMYSVNQPGESKNFDEKTVAELHNKVFNLLYNVLAFYDLYRDASLESAPYMQSENILDQWIVARLGQLTETMTENLEAYKLLEPVRALREFIDDFSTWYVRRSRDRMKDGDAEAKQTLYFVLKTLAKLMAPFAPFAAEDIWQKLKNESDEASVHFAKWPSGIEVNTVVLEKMQSTRVVVTFGMEARQKEKFPVRQPLQKITIKNYELAAEYNEILKDELNVKEIATDLSIESDVKLDTTITPELKREGEYRELVRSIQDMRKKQGLTPSDVITLTLPKNTQETIVGFEDDLKKTVLAQIVTFSGEEIVIVK
jgi:isoleucyl-tRNA synthetase